MLQGLVPGDICIISIGNIVPADVKCLGVAGDEDTPLQVSSTLAFQALPCLR